MSSHSNNIPQQSLPVLVEAVTAIRQDVLDYVGQNQAVINGMPEQNRDSANNLLHYLALRQHDLRDLQNGLKRFGLSRLASAEAHVLPSIDAVLLALKALAGIKRNAPDQIAASAIEVGDSLLRRNADALLGPARGPYSTRIMVTLPSEAASQPQLVEDLLNAGADSLRINCAHDNAEAWLAMIAHVRQAEQVTGRACRIHVDLAGPKLRTGPIEPIGRMVEFKPQRDNWGRVTAPARIWLTPGGAEESPSVDVDAVLPIPDELIRAINARDVLDIEDSRGSMRHLKFKERFGNSWLAVCFQHGYVMQDALCRLYRDDNLLLEAKAGPLPDVCLPLKLKIGDPLLVTRPGTHGVMAVHDEAGRLQVPAAIPCTLDAVFTAASPGQSIWFDDGRIGGTIISVSDEDLIVEINHAAPQGSKLRSEKGINLPETVLDVSALTEEDKNNLVVLAAHVDSVGLSFVRSADDLASLYGELDRLDLGQPAVIAKIETGQGFEHLPEILLAGMARPGFGVMVARGDLAVEVGFERLAEVQEEILWLCEAAHVPVIWATQVLETMSKRGIPSRAEVSDATLSARAECVMLNKGPFIVETTRFLSGILTRMHGHGRKRSPVSRRLAVSKLNAGDKR